MQRSIITLLTAAFLVTACDDATEYTDQESVRDIDPCGIYVDETMGPLVLDAYHEAILVPGLPEECETVTVYLPPDSTGAPDLSYLEFVEHGDVTVEVAADGYGGYEADPRCNPQAQSCPSPPNCSISSDPSCPRPTRPLKVKTHLTGPHCADKICE